MYKRLLIGALATIAISGNVLAHGACGETQLHKDMVDIKNHLKEMSTNIKSGDNGEAIKNIDAVIASFKAAKTETPYLFKHKELAGDELASQEAKFKGVIDDTIDVFTSLEEALKANDSAKVKELLGKIGKQRHIGHSNFKADC